MCVCVTVTRAGVAADGSSTTTYVSPIKFSIVAVAGCMRNMPPGMPNTFLQLHDFTYIQPGSLTQKYEAFRPLYFTWHDSSAGAMVGMTNK